MKLMQYITIVLLILYPNIIMAQSIKDISRNDANYKLINNAIKLMKNLRHVKEEVHFIRVLKSDE